jgi:biofilm protein TabA
VIVDLVDNWKMYPLGEAWQCAFDFLQSLTPDAEEKTYKLLGDDIYAMVMSVQTGSPKDAIAEAHEVYADIHMLLDGREIIDWYPTGTLTVDKPYDTAGDVMIYKRPAEGATSILLAPGKFVSLLPHDAHSPCLTVGVAPQQIKKVVVKVKADMLRPQG